MRDAGFLEHLAPHRFLEGLARLDEAREARPHAGRKARLPPEETTLAVDREHDHAGIGARKMMRAAGRAIAPPAGLGAFALVSAFGAEAVRRVPGQERLGGGKPRQVLGRETLHRDRAEIEDQKIAARLQRLGGRLRQRNAGARRAIGNPDEHPLEDRPEASRFFERKQRIEFLAAAREHDDFAADRVDAGIAMAFRRRDEGRVAASLRRAVERGADIAERRPGAEIETRAVHSVRLRG